MTNEVRLATLSDDQLLAELRALTTQERAITVRVIAALAELDARRLFLGLGYSSLFTYCTQALHLSEHAAYGRIEAARAARRFPVILGALADGSLTLRTVCLVAPHLTAENCEHVLASASRKSKREVQHLVAALAPQPAVPSVVRKLPGKSTGATPPIADPSATFSFATHAERVRSELWPATRPPQPAVVVPLAPSRYKLQVTLSTEGYDALRELQDLLRHTNPGGDPAPIVERALIELRRQVRSGKTADASQPRSSCSGTPHSRHVPAAVRREVWTRDAGRCAYVGLAGRCAERGFLEYHHLVPYADGGATTAENIQLRCRAHNAYEASEWDRGELFRERKAAYLTRSGPSSRATSRSPHIRDPTARRRHTNDRRIKGCDPHTL